MNMMRSHVGWRGSSVALAAVTQMAMAAGFMIQRRRVVDLVPVSQPRKDAYVWRRIFLSGREQKY